VNAAVSMLIREGKTAQVMSIMQTAKKEGMTLLNEELARFCKEDLVEPAEAYSKAVDKEGFLKALDGHGIKFNAPAE
jgi:twitching motility protein PilT